MSRTRATRSRSRFRPSGCTHDSAQHRRLLHASAGVSSRAMSLTYEEMRSALEGEKLPCVVVDLDAFDRNLGRHLAILKPRGTPMRLATKSVRVPALIRRVLQHAGGHGLMCFDVDEAVALAKEGHDDLLVAYPTLQPKKLEALAELTANGRNVSLAIDSEEA